MGARARSTHCGLMAVVDMPLNIRVVRKTSDVCMYSYVFLVLRYKMFKKGLLVKEYNVQDVYSLRHIGKEKVTLSVTSE